ncbi:MAG: tRNA (N6-threonylcarbamoyladenosine(37)-N6)-methyltransferase TrmO [Polyangia bacterium]
MGMAGDMLCAALIASGASEKGVAEAMNAAGRLLGGNSIDVSRGRLLDGSPARRISIDAEEREPLAIADAPGLLERSLRTTGVRGGYAGYAQRALSILCRAERVAHATDETLSREARLASLAIVGTARTPYRERAPYQPQNDREANETGFYIEVEKRYARALDGLDSFSHLFVLSHLERSAGYGLLVRPPWKNDEEPLGLFATRSPNRPSPIGLTRARLKGIEGNRIQTGQLDLFDGTPVLDIKPYIQSLDGEPTGAVSSPRAANDGWLAGSDHLELHRRGIPHEHPGGGQLHEAQDILLDITGSAWALQSLGADLDNVRCLGPVRVGGGTTGPTSHGRLRVPAPATRSILDEHRIPYRAGPVDAELLTPTGAALLAALSPSFVAADSGIPNGLRSAAGLGKRNFGADRPNALKLYWEPSRAHLPRENAMDGFRVCIGSNDGESVVKTHMGETERFFVYDVSRNGETEFVEKRNNEAIDMGHASGEKMKAVMAILDDVDVFVAIKNSPNFERIAAKSKHQPVVVNRTNVKGVLELLARSFDEIDELVTARRNGRRDGVIPQLS